jgi:hypothetical protein
MAKAAQPEKIGFVGRFRQIGQVIAFTAKRDRLYLPLAITAVALPLIAFIVLVAVGVLAWFWLIGAILIAALAFMIVLNLRSQHAYLAEAEGQPGAATQIVEMMRGDWRVKPGIAVVAAAIPTESTIVSLILGRPGIILLGEGPNRSRVRQMIGQEKKRLAKVIGSTDMRDIVIGNGEGEIPLGKVRPTLMKLPRTITARDVNLLDTRLKALYARPQMPKGTIPKNMRPPNLRMPRR